MLNKVNQSFMATENSVASTSLKYYTEPGYEFNNISVEGVGYTQDIKTYFSLRLSGDNILINGEEEYSSGVLVGESVTLYIEPNPETASLPVTVGFEECDSTWDKESGILILSNFRDDISAVISAGYKHSVQIHCNNCLVDGEAEFDGEVEKDGALSLEITADGVTYLVPNEISNLPEGSEYRKIDDTRGILVVYNLLQNIDINIEGMENPWLWFKAEEANSSISIAKSSTSLSVKFYYTTDTPTASTDWQALTSSKSIILEKVGDKVYIKQTLGYTANASYYSYFTMSGKISCGGSIMSLIKGYPTGTTISNDYALYRIFSGCTALQNSPELPATTLSSNCYYYMFKGCSSITQPPVLPATTLAPYCYANMFNGCSSIKQPPVLPATTLAPYCYANMFESCTSLESVPKLQAITLASYCYYAMFYICTNLTAIPKLPATELKDGCYYYMFGSCSSIKLSTSQTGDYKNSYRIPYGTESGTTASSALNYMFRYTGGSVSTPSINTTYYTSNEVVG